MTETSPIHMSVNRVHSFYVVFLCQSLGRDASVMYGGEETGEYVAYVLISW